MYLLSISFSLIQYSEGGSLKGGQTDPLGEAGSKARNWVQTCIGWPNDTQVDPQVVKYF